MTKKKEKQKDTANQQQIEEYKNKYLRALADFDNFKKRMAVEKEQFAQFANEKLILELLPVVDGFDRATATIKQAKASAEVQDGLALIKKQLESVLKKHGAEEIDAKDKPFDPNFHHAVLQQEDDGPEDMVIEQAQKGYNLNGKLIRPAMVVVSKKKQEERKNV